MFRSKFLLFCLVQLLFSALGLAQSAAISIDDRFDDWLPGLSTFTDIPESIVGIDLLQMQVTNDANFLYIKLVVDSDIDLSDELIPHTLTLFIDADNDANTGFSVQSGFGSEMGLRFNENLVFYDVVPPSQQTQSDISLRSSPTITSDTFELAISRSAVPDGVNPLFSGDTIRVLFKELDGGDEMPNVGTTFTYVFDSTPIPALGLIDIEKGSVDQIRAVAYNVKNSGLSDAGRVGNFENIIKALAPDVIGFNECYSTSAAAVKSLMDVWLPLGTANGWFAIKDEDLIVASRWPFLNSWPSITRQFPVLIDLPANYNTDLLFTPVHLSCCANDAGRQDQVDEYVAFMLDATSPGGNVDLPPNTPFIYAGDLNLVGYAQQLTTLLTGDIQNTGTYGSGGNYDWDGTDVTAQICRQTDMNMTYTWRNDNGSYPPGRLDYILFSDAVLNVEKAFALRTDNMSALRLAQFGLNAYDTGDASDHFSLVSDFSFPAAVQEIKVNIKAYLEGPFNGVNMDDDLRTAALVPLTEPYTTLGYNFTEGVGSSIDPALLNTVGNNAPVDWVIVELRDKTDAVNVLASKPALILRNGNVVDTTGIDPVRFELGDDDYYISLRHRNHLGVMSLSPISLSSTSIVLDLTDPLTPVFGTEALKSNAGIMLLWMGDVNFDGTIKYTGINNDRDPILTNIGGVVPTALNTGYFGEDSNMDGTVKYTGLNNDRDPILVNIGGVVPTATRTAQLP